MPRKGAGDSLDDPSDRKRRYWCARGEHADCNLAHGMTLEDLLGPDDGPEISMADFHVTHVLGMTTAEWLEGFRPTMGH